MPIAAAVAAPDKTSSITGGVRILDHAGPDDDLPINGPLEKPLTMAEEMKSLRDARAAKGDEPPAVDAETDEAEPPAVDAKVDDKKPDAPADKKADVKPADKPKDEPPAPYKFSKVIKVDGIPLKIELEGDADIERMAGLGLTAHKRLREAMDIRRDYERKGTEFAQRIKAKDYTVYRELGLTDDDIYDLFETGIRDWSEGKLKTGDDPEIKKQREDLTAREQSMNRQTVSAAYDRLAGDLAGILEKSKIPADPELIDAALGLQIENLELGLNYDLEDALKLTMQRMNRVGAPGKLKIPRGKENKITDDEISKVLEPEEIAALEEYFKIRLTAAAKPKPKTQHLGEPAAGVNGKKKGDKMSPAEFQQMAYA